MCLCSKQRTVFNNNFGYSGCSILYKSGGSTGLTKKMGLMFLSQLQLKISFAQKKKKNTSNKKKY